MSALTVLDPVPLPDDDLDLQSIVVGDAPATGRAETPTYTCTGSPD